MIDCGIAVVLNYIYNFPTSQPDEWREIVSFDRQIQMLGGHRVTAIFNEFTLFRDSPIARDPKRYAITRLMEPPSEHDLQIHLDYVDGSGRGERDLELRELFNDESLGLQQVATGQAADPPSLRRRWESLSALNRVSFGFGSVVSRGRFFSPSDVGLTW